MNLIFFPLGYSYIFQLLEFSAKASSWWLLLVIIGLIMSFSSSWGTQKLSQGAQVGLRKYSGSGEFDLLCYPFHKIIAHHNPHVCLWVPGMDLDMTDGETWGVVRYWERGGRMEEYRWEWAHREEEFQATGCNCNQCIQRIPSHWKSVSTWAGPVRKSAQWSHWNNDLDSGQADIQNR